MMALFKDTEWYTERCHHDVAVTELSLGTDLPQVYRVHGDIPVDSRPVCIQYVAVRYWALEWTHPL
jgi:hypothetical protein